MALRNLIIVLGDQLDPDGAALDDFDPARDRIWMAEVPGEATFAWSHKARIALFLSAMRHFRNAQQARRRPITYRALDEHEHATLDAALSADIDRLRPRRLIVAEPGEWRVARALDGVARRAGLPLEVRPDRHFYVSLDRFEAWIKGRREPRLEDFYRAQRKRLGILMKDGKPVGGRWNFDRDNRRSFGKQGPGLLPGWPCFEPDAVTRGVLKLVERRFPDHPGRLDRFDWPVTPEQARDALRDFIDYRLSAFGPYQDAMWTQAPNLYHSRLSSALNLKLLNPRQTVDAAIDAWRERRAHLASVEGFVRQILGWREFVRGLYWHYMPDWLDWNVLGAKADLPPFYWTGETDMRCLAHAIGDTLEYGYAHHIQRLMVTGLFAMLFGAAPRRVHEWYLAIYVDAVEWVELPNTVGMSQYADGGIMGSKPYAASGRYVQRMSNYCSECRFDPGQRTGKDACPFTTLYWDFLMRHRERFSGHPRTSLQWRNLERIDASEQHAIRSRAGWLRKHYATAHKEK